MCYDPKDRPPDPPFERGTSTGQDLVLTTVDGNRFAAYLATPGQPVTAQVLIYPDVRGLHGFYTDLALRFGELGIRALVLDYFGRTAGISARDETFDYMPHVQQIQLSQFFSDVAASLDYLQKDTHHPTFTLGFCMGGSLSLLTGAQNFNLAGIIAFYAGFTRKFGGAEATTLELASKIHYPVLGLFGGADQGIPESDVKKLDETIPSEHQIIIYPGAPHSFFDRKANEFADASADAWKRVLNFIAAHSAAN